MDDVLIELDDRRRTNLGKVGRKEHRRYLVHEEPDGTLILKPAVIMTEFEATFLRNNPEIIAGIEESVKHPESFVDRPSRKTPRSS